MAKDGGKEKILNLLKAEEQYHRFHGDEITAKTYRDMLADAQKNILESNYLSKGDVVYLDPRNNTIKKFIDSYSYGIDKTFTDRYEREKANKKSPYSHGIQIQKDRIIVTRHAIEDQVEELKLLDGWYFVYDYNLDARIYPI